MKVLTLLASPRKNGYTSDLLKAYTEGLTANKSQIDITKKHLEKMTIHACKGCNACQKNKVNFCVTDDDMIQLYEEIIESDIIVLASPIYFFSVTAQMKSVLDRLYAILDRVKGKKIVLLTTYGAAKLEDSGVENAVKMIRMTNHIAGTELMQEYHVTTGHEEGNTITNQAALQEVFELGQSISI